MANSNLIHNFTANAWLRQGQPRLWLQLATASALFILSLSPLRVNAADEFDDYEAGIDDIQQAIKNGESTCEGVVRAYIERAKAYNGSCTALVTEHG